ncbi:hypothetical protein CYMTET_23742 [Cymbomonas tetramitiformis]|uniref:Uncharacterized protein n=1 Tax=Cymbomonas tetramitiformis TaxID=36881 RepID=A0AAE0L0M5_9CHLO|nr:hypothetical protein CYMTET_23742 [Cymbomonas tetramitiformis]
MPQGEQAEEQMARFMPTAVSQGTNVAAAVRASSALRGGNASLAQSSEKYQQQLKRAGAGSYSLIWDIPTVHEASYLRYFSKRVGRRMGRECRAGVGYDGTRILKSTTVAAMLMPQTEPEVATWTAGVDLTVSGILWQCHGTVWGLGFAVQYPGLPSLRKWKQQPDIAHFDINEHSGVTTMTMHGPFFNARTQKPIPYNPGTAQWAGAAGSKWFIDPKEDFVICLTTNIKDYPPTIGSEYWDDVAFWRIYDFFQ